LDDQELAASDPEGARRSAALIDVRSRPGEVLSRYIDDPLIRDTQVEAALFRRASRIGRDAVDRALRSPVREVRRFGLRLATAKRSISAATAETMLSAEQSGVIRVEIVKAMLAAGHAVDVDQFAEIVEKRDDDVADFGGYDEQQAVAVQLARELDREELAQRVEWSTPMAATYYEALGLVDGDWADRHVRRDLTSDFVRLERRFRNELDSMVIRQPISAAMLDTLDDRQRAAVADTITMRVEEFERNVAPFFAEDKLGGFIRRSFRLAALRILVARGKRGDVRFARQFAQDTDQSVRVEALRLFEVHGTAHDVEAILALGDQVYAEREKRRAAETALRLAYKKDKLHVLARLRESRLTSDWSVRQLATIPRGVDAAWELLWAEKPDVRRAAADVVWDQAEAGLADPLLSLYMQRRHYYNVVRAVDERLYAPDWLD
jgi:hypothetical protein